MKRLICCLAILLSVIYSYSQRVYFVYLQSDPEQAFYVRVKDNVYSSSASGYLILSKLRDSSYSFTVGFPQNKWPEQQFKVNVAAKDHGYILRNFGEKGWGLYDLQTSSVQMGTGNAAISGREENKDVSAFTDVLAKAANDPSLRDKPIRKEEPKVEVQQAVVKTEEPKSVKKEDTPPINAVTTTTKKETTPKIEKKTDADAPKEMVQSKKVDSPAVNQGMAIKNDATIPGDKEKKDTEEKKPDTIVTNTVAEKKIEAPKTDPPRNEIVKADPPKVDPPKTDTEASAIKADPPKADAKKVDAVNESVTSEYKASVVKRKSESSTSEGFGLTFVDEYPDGKKDTIKILIPNPKSKIVLKEAEKQQPKEEKRFLDITADSKEVTGDSKKDAVADVKIAGKEEKPKTMKCSFAASESDFLKLRRRMAGVNGDEAMLSEAIKAFKAKCYAVDQLKNLSTLFLNDAGKYRFFDAAYATVFDPTNFSQLQTELKDEYYVNRFKAMLR